MCNEDYLYTEEELEELLRKQEQELEEQDKYLSEFADRFEIPILNKKNSGYKWKIRIKPNTPITDEKLANNLLTNDECLYNWIFYSRQASKYTDDEESMTFFFDAVSDKIIDKRIKQLMNKS